MVKTLEKKSLKYRTTIFMFINLFDVGTFLRSTCFDLMLIEMDKTFFLQEEKSHELGKCTFIFFINLQHNSGLKGLINRGKQIVVITEGSAGSPD